MAQTNFAFVFPGQGSQSLGMLSDLASEVTPIFEEASAALGYDLWQLIQEGPASELNQTHRTQPALLAASVAVWRLWTERGGALPAQMAGHSLGEYSALVSAGAMTFGDAVKLVELRGQLMQEAVPAGVGAMSAIIGLDDDAVRTACEGAAEGEVVSPVNFNSPGQVVIAGNAAAVDRANALCKAAGAKRAMPLAVSVPSHCILMKPAAEKLATALADITIDTPKIPVINNVDVSAETEAAKIRDALVRQLYLPVRWTEVVQKMAGQGITQLVEMGPGKVLTGLTRRIDRSLGGMAVNTTETFATALEQLR